MLGLYFFDLLPELSSLLPVLSYLLLSLFYRDLQLFYLLALGLVGLLTPSLIFFEPLQFHFQLHELAVEVLVFTDHLSDCLLLLLSHSVALLSDPIVDCFQVTILSL